MADDRREIATAKRARRWMATVFFKYEDPEWINRMGLELVDIDREGKFNIRMSTYSGPELIWIKGQVEICPSTAREHVQVAMEYKNAVPMSTVQAFWESKPHCEAIKQDKTGEYGCKELTRAIAWVPIRWGKLPNGKETQGKRNDVIRIKEMILEGKPLIDIIMEVPSAMRMTHHIEKVQDMIAPRRENMTKLFIIVGPGGTGKSHYARAHSPGAYWLAPGDKYKWWDNYKGERVVIIDEFEPTHMSFSKLKRLVDKYPLSVEKKGSSANFVAEELYLINNHDPRDWYPEAEMESEAWKRRVTGVCWVESLVLGNEIMFHYHSWDEFCISRPRVKGHINGNNGVVVTPAIPTGAVPGFYPRQI